MTETVADKHVLDVYSEFFVWPVSRLLIWKVMSYAATGHTDALSSCFWLSVKEKVTSGDQSHDLFPMGWGVHWLHTWQNNVTFKFVLFCLVWLRPIPHPNLHHVALQVRSRDISLSASFMCKIFSVLTENNCTGQRGWTTFTFLDCFYRSNQ